MECRDMEFGSRLLGGEPRGCVQCREGAKMVLLVTGLCRFRCFYCPLSEKKLHRDVVYANELQILGEDNDDKVLDEARSILAMGTGITGGDPLLVLERTEHYIRLLKDEFGEEHHIHLYTGTIPTNIQLRSLREAGLDEIRYHLIDIVAEENVPLIGGHRAERLEEYTIAIKESISIGLDTGVEIPVLPHSFELLIWLAPLLEDSTTMFLNLNELEFSPTNSRKLLSRGYRIRDDLSSAVLGSMETAYRFMDWAAKQDFIMAIHFCSSKFKDAGQLRKRLNRRARNIALAHEYITDDDTLLIGILESNGDLQETAEVLKEKYGIPDELVYVNRKMQRIEIAAWVLQEIAEQLTTPAYIIEEYPSADRLEVEREKLN